MAQVENGPLVIRHNATTSMPWTFQSYLLFLLMITSGIGGALTYVEIDQLNEDKSSIISGFPLGVSRYSLHSGGQCVGHVDFATEQQAGSLTINGTGSIRVKNYDLQIELGLEMQASFNALRQLGGSYLKVQSPDLSLLVSTLNIRPIEITAKVLNPTLGEVFRSEIAGPIVYEQVDKGQVTIKGLQLNDSLASMKLVSQQPLFKDISIGRGLNDMAPCQDNSGALNIQPLLAFSETFAALLPQGMIP